MCYGRIPNENKRSNIKNFLRILPVNFSFDSFFLLWSSLHSSGVVNTSCSTFLGSSYSQIQKYIKLIPVDFYLPFVARFAHILYLYSIMWKICSCNIPKQKAENCNRSVSPLFRESLREFDWRSQRIAPCYVPGIYCNLWNSLK